MRYITADVLADLERKMVFIGGPRQVGKTTLVRHILDQHYPGGRYFNWDYDEDRRALLKERWKSDTPLLIFDELHKYPRWKSWIKGLYDTRPDGRSFLVTGSARLDIYKKGGDSLLGRYHYWRLHPFSLDEYPADVPPETALERLLTIGGFPEVFISGEEREARRWRRERLDRVIREDIRDLESIRNITQMELMTSLLRERVGGPAVASNLAEDIQVSPKTVQAWLAALERMYVVFRVMPFTKNLSRAILKTPKFYFFDTGDVLGDTGARFENMVATALLKRLHYYEDRDGFRYELRYIRDKEGREVDFVILKDGAVLELIEVKYADSEPSRALRYYTERLHPVHSTQIVKELTAPFDAQGIRVTNPISYFSGFGEAL
jgi:hypothetical protein